MDSTQPRSPLRKRKPDDTCDLHDCDAPFVARGMCRKHYAAWDRATPKDQRTPASGLSRLTVADRFWSKIDKSSGPEACWPWQGSRHRFGHGQFHISLERGRVQAHSYALELASGWPCPPGQEACHHCDNPPCCNPSHLYYGTRQQNVDDMWKRGRAHRGSARTQALLTEASVIQIRHRYAAGEMAKVLAVEFHVTHGAITAVVLGKTWRHIGGPIQKPWTPRPWRSNNKRSAV